MLETTTKYEKNPEYKDCKNYDEELIVCESEVSTTGTKTVKSYRIFFLTLKNLKSHKRKHEKFQKMKRTLHAIKKLVKNSLIFIEIYLQNNLMYLRIKFCHF